MQLNGMPVRVGKAPYARSKALHASRASAQSSCKPYQQQQQQPQQQQQQVQQQQHKQRITQADMQSSFVTTGVSLLCAGFVVLEIFSPLAAIAAATPQQSPPEQAQQQQPKHTLLGRMQQLVSGGQQDHPSSLPPLEAPPHASADKVSELRQLTGAGAVQQQQELAVGAEAAAVQALSSVLDINDYSARSLIDQEPALLELKEKQLKVQKQVAEGI